MTTEQRAPVRRPPGVVAPRNNRAAISNGRWLPRGVDGRSAVGRRWKDLFAAYRTEMPSGMPTTAQETRLRVLATVSLRLEQIAAAAAQGEVVDDALLVSLTNVQGRLLDSLGLLSEPLRVGDDDPAAHLARIRDPEYWKGGTR